MIEEIKEKYEDFADSLISQVSYLRTLDNQGIIEITLAVMNAENDYKFENIKLVLSNISTFRFVEMNNTSSLIIYGAILSQDNGVITLDFFPEIHDDKYVVNEESDFLVRCKHITYEFIENLA